MSSRFSLLASALLGLAIQPAVLAQGAPQGTIGGLFRSCQQKWGGDARMMNYCMKNQVLDYNRVKNSGDDQATQECKERYGSDYSMVRACLSNKRGQSSEAQATTQAFDEMRPAGTPSTFVNGIRIDTCSHGKLCYGQILDAMHLSN
jgi:hypothetical protein